MSHSSTNAIVLPPYEMQHPKLIYTLAFQTGHRPSSRPQHLLWWWWRSYTGYVCVRDGVKAEKMMIIHGMRACKRWLPGRRLMKRTDIYRIGKTMRQLSGWQAPEDIPLFLMIMAMKGRWNRFSFAPSSCIKIQHRPNTKPQIMHYKCSCSGVKFCTTFLFHEKCQFATQ